ncbi:MAG TPA: DUF5611 family protein [Candidatus Thermoplasmatota archaeon]
MQEYEVKRGLAKKTDLRTLFSQQFGSVNEEGGWLVGGFGAMPVIRAKYDKDTLVVDTTSKTDLAARVAKGDKTALEEALDTQKRWNDFLLTATGYDTKQRGKKAQEKAKKAAKVA